MHRASKCSDMRALDNGCMQRTHLTFSSASSSILSGRWTNPSSYHGRYHRGNSSGISSHGDRVPEWRQPIESILVESFERPNLDSLSMPSFDAAFRSTCKSTKYNVSRGVCHTGNNRFHEYQY